MRKKLFAKIFLTLCISICLFEVSCLTYGKISIWDEDNKEKILEGYFPLKRIMKEIYGVSNIILSPNEKISGVDRIIKNEDGYLEHVNKVRYDVNEAKKKISELNEVCQEKGVQFSYISYPSKSYSDNVSTEYGIETDYEETRVDFLNYLDKQNIDYLDVKDLLEKDGYTKRDIFYKTDHHWKSTVGFYAAHAIAEHLNDVYGYSLDTDALDKSKFDFITYDNLWFGETGRSLSRTWVGVLDDFTEIVPKYNTSLTISEPNGNEVTGDFKIMIDESGYHSDVDYYSYSAHYSYEQYKDSPCKYHNNLNVNGKKILIIKDSFSAVVTPFLILETSDVTTWDMRMDRTKNGLYDYIRNNDFDVVLLAYTDFWSEKMWNFN